jgi:hypothetical protein
MAGQRLGIKKEPVNLRSRRKTRRGWRELGAKRE